MSPVPGKCELCCSGVSALIFIYRNRQEPERGCNCSIQSSAFPFQALEEEAPGVPLSAGTRCLLPVVQLQGGREGMAGRKEQGRGSCLLHPNLSLV